MNVIESAIKEINRQVREQAEARRWCESHPYPSSMDEVLSGELERRQAFCPPARQGGQS